MGANRTSAVIQRARLLNAMLFDLYGKQRLVYESHLPPALVFGNPQFLRPCAGINVPDGVHLHTYAADLARSPSGQWWVIADRTQAPAGIGYALENRLVSARTLPSVFSQYRVRQLGRFFDSAPRRRCLNWRRAQASDQPARRVADARPAQRNLLRAFVPRAATGDFRSSKATT